MWPDKNKLSVLDKVCEVTIPKEKMEYTYNCERCEKRQKSGANHAVSNGYLEQKNLFSTSTQHNTELVFLTTHL